MGRPVITIGLETADFSCMERWIEQGHLSNLKNIKNKGCFGRLRHLRYYADETTWTTFLTGCFPDKTGFWSPLKFRKDIYSVDEIGAYLFKKYPPFYTLAPSHAIAIFDIPHCNVLFPKVNGVQALAWGAKDPMGPAQSDPKSLLSELTDKFGSHPASEIKNRVAWWDESFLQRLKRSLHVGISQRVEICKYLLGLRKWDFFLTVFSEIHIAQHQFWHLSEPDHPLYFHKAWPNQNPLLSVYKAIDHAIGEILKVLPSEASVWIFSLDSGGNNQIDLLSQLFLPEYLYRHSFSGKRLLGHGGRYGNVKTPILKLKTRDWLCELWRLKRGPVLQYPDFGKRFPIYAYQQIYQLFEYLTLWRWRFPYHRLGVLGWQPATWYRFYWPAMKAFALPSYGDGYIRINLKGREPQGIVNQADYSDFCDELINTLKKLKNSRTGSLIVREVIRTRKHGTEEKPNLPDADLVVIWDEPPADIVEHPELGRIGPVPFRSTGGHRAGGFFLAMGENLPQNTEVKGGKIVDLAPTFLDLLGMEKPEYFDGKSLLQI